MQNRPQGITMSYKRNKQRSSSPVTPPPVSILSWLRQRPRHLAGWLAVAFCAALVGCGGGGGETGASNNNGAVASTSSSNSDGAATSPGAIDNEPVVSTSINSDEFLASDSASNAVTCQKP